MDPIVKKQIRDRNIMYALSRWTGISPEKPEAIIEKKPKENKEKEWVFYYKNQNQSIGLWTKVKKMVDKLHDELLKGKLIYEGDKTKTEYCCIEGTYAKALFNYETGRMDLRPMNSYGGTLYDLKCEMEVFNEESNVDLVERYNKWFDLSLIDSLQQSIDTKVTGPFDYTEICLDPEESEFKLLSEFFKLRSHKDNRYVYEIDKIRKINHPVKARKYIFEREMSDNKTEALLFHGSKATDTDVLKGGLDMRHSRVGNSGRAIYLSNSTDYSHGYTNKSTLYLVQTLIGNIYKQEDSPTSLSSTPEGYNSVWHYQKNPDVSSEDVDIFALYSNDHAFITHTVDYKKRLSNRKKVNS